MKTHCKTPPSYLWLLFGLLTPLFARTVWGEEKSVRLELRQEPNPKTILIRNGVHDFTEPLRIPVESANPNTEIILRHESRYIDQVRKTIETKDVDSVKTFTQLIAIDYTPKVGIEYEIRHTVSNSEANLFAEAYKVELDESTSPLLVREFSINNRTGIDWGAKTSPLRVVLIHDKRGVLLDESTTFIPNASTIPNGAVARFRQVLDCAVESKWMLIDPIAVKAGDAKQTLGLSNGALGKPGLVRAELPTGVTVNVQRKIPDPKRPLQTATFPRDVPIGPPESVSAPCACGTDAASSSSRLVLEIGSQSDVHILEVSNGPKMKWLPASITPTGLVYFTGTNRKVQIHNRSGQELPLALTTASNAEVISFSKLPSVLSIRGGETVDLSEPSQLNLKLINVATEQVAKNDNALEYLETAKAVLANLKSFVDTDQIDALRQFYCTHPATRQKTRCLSVAEFRAFLDKLISDLQQSTDSVASISKELQELKAANESREVLVGLLRQYSGPNADKYARERIRIQSRIEAIDVSIQKIQARIVPIKAELAWNANRKSYGFRGKPWEREIEPEGTISVSSNSATASTEVETVGGEAMNEDLPESRRARWERMLKALRDWYEKMLESD